MRAMVLESFGAPLQARTRPDPSPGPGEVVLRVLACGVCGSDLKVVSGALPDVGLPRVPGHEVAGKVVALGPGVAAPRVGTRVAYAANSSTAASSWPGSTSREMTPHS